MQEKREPSPSRVRPPHEHTQRDTAGQGQRGDGQGERERAKEQGERARIPEHRERLWPPRRNLRQERGQGRRAEHEQGCRRDSEREALLVTTETRAQRPAHCRSHGWILSISSATRA